MIRLELMDEAAYERYQATSIPVHGPNIGARQLYQRAGFVETDATMLNRVDG